MVELKNLKFAVLDDLFREGESYIAELDKAKAAKKTSKTGDPGRSDKKLKSLQGNTLRDRDRW